MFCVYEVRASINTNVYHLKTMWIPKCVYSFIDGCIVIYAKTRNPQQNLKNRDLYANLYTYLYAMQFVMYCGKTGIILYSIATMDRRLRNIVEKDL